MNTYSARSRKRLDSCDTRLVRVFETVLPTFDHSVLEGSRSLDRQRALFNAGKSKTMNSKHLIRTPAELSRAADVVPYPFDWDFEGELVKAVRRGDSAETRRILHNIQRWALFVGHVLMAAHVLDIKLRWGGDWDGDKDLADQNFDDWPHFEIIE